jgi:hypothetical protein
MPAPSSQSPRDRILWILNSHAGRMTLGRLRGETGMRYAIINPVLDDLRRKGKIRILDNIIELM